MLNFAPMDWRCYLNMTDLFTSFFSAVDLAQKVDVCTDVCLFDRLIWGVDPNTEIIHVIDLSVTLSCSGSTSTK